jgi:hypothetical protein
MYYKDTKQTKEDEQVRENFKFCETKDGICYAKVGAVVLATAVLLFFLIKIVKKN